MRQIRLSSLSKCLVFFDFDNTVIPFDVLDVIIRRFSINKDWMRFEKAWREGKIGSRVCLERQLRSVKLKRADLLRYVSRVKIDPYFPKLFALLRRQGIKPVILSDSFTFIIESILKNNGISKVKIYANHLKFYKERLIPFFPYIHRHCQQCAHCKKKNLLKKGIRDKIIIYVGDGLSDICPAEYSDIVFAKGRLLKYFRKRKKLCIAFNNIKDIYNYFRGLER